jgi:hypothetical protein
VHPVGEVQGRPVNKKTTWKTTNDDEFPFPSALALTGEHSKTDSHQNNHDLDLPAIRQDPSFPPASTTNVTPLETTTLTSCEYRYL